LHIAFVDILAWTILDPNAALAAAALGLGIDLSGRLPARRFGRFHGGNAPEYS
jgi:hypothetical protein